MNIINADKIGDPRRFGGLFLKILGVLLVLWAVNSAVFTIDAGHIGVVTRFGAISGATAEPGLNFKFPLIERVHEFEVRIQKETAEAAAASRDLQSVSSTIAVNFHIEAKNARQLYEELGVEFKSRVIDPAVQEVFKAATAAFTAEELITRREEV
ncbi:MAG TPA: SPFH domain-containing protein, partial [Actinomycetota bacterium]|nr:SPFH domain-containing protein [Actinomycetota bacterium]